LRRVAPRDSVLLCGVHCPITDYRSLLASRSTVTHQWSRWRRHCPLPHCAVSGF